MPGPRDNDHVIRDGSADLTNTENLTHTVTSGVHHTNPLSLLVLVPQASAGDSIKVTHKCTTTGKKVEVSHTDEIDDNTTYPFLLELPMPQSTGEAWTVDLTVTGGAGNWGAVQAWLERTKTTKVDA